LALLGSFDIDVLVLTHQVTKVAALVALSATLEGKKAVESAYEVADLDSRFIGESIDSEDVTPGCGDDSAVSDLVVRRYGKLAADIDGDRGEAQQVLLVEHLKAVRLVVDHHATAL
jgi:hypothetical protein